MNSSKQNFEQYKLQSDHNNSEKNRKQKLDEIVAPLSKLESFVSDKKS